jgi:glyceraldehyde-3-phosphate dehydrogenase/erythrose-4-phosphate dehydrogenase
MTINIDINGFGRMGRLALRVACLWASATFNTLSWLMSFRLPD